MRERILSAAQALIASHAAGVFVDPLPLAWATQLLKVNTMNSCMGGWCDVRDNCALHTTEHRANPVDRLCEPGQSDAYEPITVRREVGTLERKRSAPVAPATWMDGVAA